MTIDPIELSRELIAFNTINPELSCIRHLERTLAGAGLQTSLHTFAPERANLIARIGGRGGKPPLCFTGMSTLFRSERRHGLSMRSPAKS